jgi:hypothetical protein
MPILVFGDNTGNDYTGSDGTNINQSQPTTVQTGGLDIGKYTASGHRTGLLSFSGMSNLPAAITVSSAVVTAYLRNPRNGNHVFTSRRLLRNWVKSQATWNQYSTGNNWATGGALSNSDRSSTISAVSETIPATIGYYELLEDSAQLRSDVENIASGANPNHGWQIERTDGQNDASWRVFYDETGTDSRRPYLTVNYTAGGGDTAGTFNSTSSSVASFSGSLSSNGAFSSVSASSVSFNSVLVHGATFASTSASAFSADGSLSLNGSFNSTITSALTASSLLVNNGSFDSVAASTSSFDGSSQLNGNFASTTASVSSFNGELITSGVGTFTSVTGSVTSFIGTLSLNALFSTTTGSAASFNGSLSGTSAGVLSSEASTSASFNGTLFSYSSLNSVSTSAFSANGAIESTTTFNSASVSSLALAGHIDQFGLFSSASTSRFNVFNEEPAIPSKRVISSSASNRSISSSSNRIIRTQ